MKIRALPLSLFAATLLAACSPTPTPSAKLPGSGSAVSALGRIYELSVRGASDAAPQVSAQALPSGLRSQGLVTAPETLTFQSVANSSFTDPVTRTRHIQATFRVTNTGTHAFHNLVFVPISLTDTDGDASNNATAPTAAGTPFKKLGLYDGSDATARAVDLVPTQAKQITPAGRVYTDASASAFRTGLDVSRVFVTAPTGLAVGVNTYGWKASPLLAPGDSTTISFAVDLQNVDPANPRADPYSFSLVFTPVQDDPALAATGIAPQAARIQGTITDDTLFGGTALLTDAGYSQQPASFTGAIGAAGQLDLQLGVPPSSDFSPVIPYNPSYGPSCSYSGIFSDTAAAVAFYPSLGALSRQGDPVGTVEELLVGGASTEGAAVGRIYARSPLVLRGTVYCYGTSVAYSVDLVAGWNLVEVVVSGYSATIKTLAPDATSILVVTRRAPGVSGALDDTSTINLKPGEQVTRSLKLLQVGAYKGTVKLSTNVPGVSVQPGSVNLSPLGTQALRPAGIGTQSLSTPITFVAAPDAPEHFPYMGPDALIYSDADGRELGRTPIGVVLVIPSVRVGLSEVPLLTQGQTVPVSVSLTSVNGFSGPVTVSLSGLPGGVTVVAQTVDLTAGSSLPVTLQLSASATATLGSSTIKLETTPAYDPQFNYSPAQATLTVVAPPPPLIPSVNASINQHYNLVTITQGGMAEVQVSLSSLNGLNGPVTVSLSGLPEGVTAAPHTVQVTPGTAASVTLHLNASATATLAQYATIKLETDVPNEGYFYSAQTQLSVVASPPPPTPGVYSVFDDYGTSVLAQQGDTVFVPVILKSKNGLSGSVTVRLSNLPDGVTAEPQTILVDPSTDRVLSMKLTVSGSAPIGDFFIRLETSLPNDALVNFDALTYKRLVISALP